MSAIKLQSLTPNIVVEDVNKTVEYYVMNFGFSMAMSVPETGKLNWAMITRDNISLMLQSFTSMEEDLPELKLNKKGTCGTFYVEMNGVDKLYQQVKGKVTIASDLRTTFYGKKEFTVKDLNDQFLTFAEDAR